MRRSCHFRGRRGFTLVELLVALILFDCALLALAGGTALVVRQAGSTTRRAIAQVVIDNRLAGMNGSQCPPPQTGSSEPSPGLHERWGVVALDSITRLLDDSVVVDLPGRRIAIAVHSARRC
jgi:type II secretion system protein I